MSIVELVQKLGVENIHIQGLENAFSKADYNGKKGCTFITFGTQAITVDDLMSEVPFRNKIGIVLWIDREKYNEAIK